MPRIRSVHPGLWTDEAFASLSEAAQIFLVGLWTEADDQGVFECKPLTLRMRLRPTKDGPVEPILGELEAANIIRRYELHGRQYGAIRNFRKYQRPKKPNPVHVLPPEFRTYVGLSGPSSELPSLNGQAAPPIRGESSPIRNQMEEGGGRTPSQEGNSLGEVVSYSDGGRP